MQHACPFASAPTHLRALQRAAAGRLLVGHVTVVNFLQYPLDHVSTLGRQDSVYMETVQWLACKWTGKHAKARLLPLG